MKLCQQIKLSTKAPINRLAVRASALSIILLLNSIFPLFGNAQDRMRRPPISEGGEVQNYLIPGATTLPDGTILVCRMETRLDSKTARPSDRFTARVLVPITDARGRTLVPGNSLIEGHVVAAQRAQSRRRSGIIEVTFDQLTLAAGQRYRLLGNLAPATTEDRKRFDDEGNIRAKGGNAKRTVAFIGGGAGAGALVGAVTAGALLGAGVGAGIGVFAALLAKGKEAIVEPGTKIGVELTQPLALRTSNVGTSSSDTSLVPYRPQPDITNTPTNNYPPYTNPPYNNPPLNNRPPLVRPTPPSYTPNPRPRPGATTPRPGTTTSGTTPQSRPTPRPAPVTIRPGTGGDADNLQPVNVSTVLAERSADGTLRISITGQAPSSGWKLAPEYVVEGSALNIRLRGAPPQGLSNQVISYPTTVVTLKDPLREIQRVTVKGGTTARTTTPISRGGGGTSGTGGNTGSNSSSGEVVSAAGQRIADKQDALVEDFARSMRALRNPDGVYTFENARDGGTPEAQLLYAWDRLAESARVFRGALTLEVKRKAVRELVNAQAQANRLLPFVRIAAEFTQRWQGIQTEISQLAQATPGATTVPPARPR
jgi:hypothetical protein